MAGPTDPWIATISALLAGGGAKFAWDTYKDYRAMPSTAERKTQRKVASVDASIVTVSRARDELEEDNSRLRATMVEDQARWQAERDRYEKDKAAWQTEKAGLQAEIRSLQVEVREVRDEGQRRYNEVLERLATLAQKYAGGEQQ